MNDKFYEQKKEKQDMLINGAMQVFAMNGYKHASVDEMVKISGVSKGLWFHYFENKKGLYSFVVSYAVKYALLELGMRIEDDLCDYYELILAVEHVKMELMEMYPYLPRLIISILYEDEAEALELIGDTLESYKEKMESIMMLADRSHFPEGFDCMKLHKMIEATFTNMMCDYYKAPVFARDAYLRECSDYLLMLKGITYQS